VSGVGRISLRALAAGAAPLLIHHFAEAPAVAPTPAFKGAWIGMSPNEWRQLPTPPGAGALAQPHCNASSTGLETSHAEGLARTESDIVICGYFDQLGGHTARAVRLTAGFLARDLTYVFTSGALSAIRFTTSIDAYNNLRAMFGERYGTPVRDDRDSVRTSLGLRARVRDIWRTPFGSVRLTDPSGNPTRISVEITNRPATGDQPLG